MSTKKNFVTVIPDGMHLDYSRDTEGAVRGTLRDNRTNKLVQHAEFHEVEEHASDDYSDATKREPDRQEASASGELGGVLAGLALVGLTLGAAAVVKAARDRATRRREDEPRQVESSLVTSAPAGWYEAEPGRQRWWDGRAWTEHARSDPNYAAAPAGWYDDGSGKQRWWDGFRWTEHVQAVSHIVHAEPQNSRARAASEPNDEIVGAAELPRLTMTSAEWQERMRAMLLARAISDQQWRLLSVARIQDADPELLGWQRQLAGLTSQQFADQLNVALEADLVFAQEVSRQALAGWYDDGSGGIRWWDGQNWTDQLQPQPLAASTADMSRAATGWSSSVAGRHDQWNGAERR